MIIISVSLILCWVCMLLFTTFNFYVHYKFTNSIFPITINGYINYLTSVDYIKGRDSEEKAAKFILLIIFMPFCFMYSILKIISITSIGKKLLNYPLF